MIVYLNFTKGTTTITDGHETGYEHSRSHVLLSVRIVVTDGYSLLIDVYSITAKYKYITVRYQRGYSIGRSNYHWNSIDQYRGSERVNLDMLQNMIIELINDSSIDGQPIEYWRLYQLTEGFRDND